MDGAEPDYIARKRYYTARDQYHTVMEAVSRMSEAGIRVVIRCNVDEENWPVFRVLWKICRYTLRIRTESACISAL